MYALPILAAFIYVFCKRKSVLSVFMMIIYSIFTLIQLLVVPDIKISDPEYLMPIYSSLNFISVILLAFLGHFYMAFLFLLNIALCFQVQFEHATGSYLIWGVPYFMLYYGLVTLELIGTWDGGDGRRMAKRFSNIFSAFSSCLHFKKGG